VIEQARKDHPHVSVATLCELLGVSRSWYYAVSECVETAQRDVELRDAIEKVVLEFPGYGYRRATKHLEREGWSVNHKRVLRVMREESLLCRLKRRYLTTTDSNHSHRTYPNLLTELTLTGLDQAWVSDITYIRLDRSLAYLAAILDAYSRKCIGWKLSGWIDTRLTLAALETALTSRRPDAGFIHHSDRGVQYAAGEYVKRLEGAGARVGRPLGVVGQGQSVRQRQGGELLSDLEERGGASGRGVRDNRGGGSEHRPIHSGCVQ